MNKGPEIGPAPASTDSDTIRNGLSAADLARAFRDKLGSQQARFQGVSTRNDHYMALAFAVRDRLLERWLQTAQTYFQRQSRTVSYLSAEFLMGPQLENNLINLGIYDGTSLRMKSPIQTHQNQA